MAGDPYTLVIALDPTTGGAEGTLYLDDGITTDAQVRPARASRDGRRIPHRRLLRMQTKGAFRLRRFSYARGGDSSGAVLSSVQIGGGKAWAPTNTVERVLVFGAGAAPKTVSVAASADGSVPARTVEFTYDKSSDTLTLRKPDVKVAYDWTISLAF